jgi:hypothetical protein
VRRLGSSPQFGVIGVMDRPGSLPNRSVACKGSIRHLGTVDQIHEGGAALAQALVEQGQLGSRRLARSAQTALSMILERNPQYAAVA